MEHECGICKRPIAITGMLHKTFIGTGRCSMMLCDDCRKKVESIK